MTQENIPWILTIILNNGFTVFQNFVCCSSEQIFTEIIEGSAGNSTKYSQHGAAGAVGTSSKHFCVYLQLKTECLHCTQPRGASQRKFNISRKCRRNSQLSLQQVGKCLYLCVFWRGSCAGPTENPGMSIRDILEYPKIKNAECPCSWQPWKWAEKQHFREDPLPHSRAGILQVCCWWENPCVILWVNPCVLGLQALGLVPWAVGAGLKAET